MITTFLKSLILLISIPVINSISFGLGTLIHTPTQTTITTLQYDSYQQAMILLIVSVGILLFMVETYHDRLLKNNLATSLIYVTTFTILATLTQEQFTFRPFEHSLTFASIYSIIITRLFLNKKLSATKEIMSLRKVP